MRWGESFKKDPGIEASFLDDLNCGLRVFWRHNVSKPSQKKGSIILDNGYSHAWCPEKIQNIKQAKDDLRTT